MAKKQEPKVEINANEPHLIEINGEAYSMVKEITKKIDGVVHDDKCIFKKFDKKEFADNLKVLVNEIGKKTTKKELLNQILKSVDAKQLRRLVKRIKQKKPIKKQHGCLGFKIGDSYIQVVD